MIGLTGKVVALNIAATTASANRAKRRPSRALRTALVLAATAVVYFGSKML